MLKKSLSLAVVLSASLAVQAADRLDARSVPVGTLQLDATIAPALPQAALSIGGLSAGGLRQQTHRPTVFENGLRAQLRLGSASDLRPLRENRDRSGHRHVRYRQHYLGVPVFGEQLIAHADASGRVAHVSGRAVAGLEQDLSADDLAVQQLSPGQAMTLAHAQVVRYLPAAALGVSPQFRNEKIEHVVYVAPNGKAHDAYSISYVAELKGSEPARPFFILDADSGVVLKTWNGLAHAEIGTGPGGNLRTGYYEYGVDKPYLDVTQSLTTCTMETGKVRTVNMNHGTSDSTNTAYSFGCPQNNYVQINGAYSPLNDAHYFGTQTDAMYQTWFGKAPLNSEIILRVHYDSNYDNAFWDGQYTNFGDGNDKFFPLSTSLNVVAHEVSHGVTEQNSDLQYYGQSGGINEAFSDMAGEAAEYFAHCAQGQCGVDWLVGNDSVRKGKAIRYFATPTKDGNSIADARNYWEGLDTHYSSGVFNRAFYLLATTAGWDVQKAFTVFYYANVDYWSPSSDYTDAACGVQEAARDAGYSTLDVSAAFAQVGVTCPLPAKDADGDYMDDDWEVAHGLNAASDDAGLDADGDGLGNGDEYRLGTDPQKADSDGDGLDDGSDPLPKDAVNLNILRSPGLFDFGDLANAQGGSVVAMGDLDGDGYSDAVIAFPDYAFRYKGVAHPHVGLVVVVSGADGQVIWGNYGSYSNERFGAAVAVIPDADGDGKADLAVGIPGRSCMNASCTSWLPKAGAVEVFSVADGINKGNYDAFATFYGETAGDRFGSAVSAIPGFRGHGGLAIGAPMVDTYDDYGDYKDAGALYMMDPSLCKGKSSCVSLSSGWIYSYYHAGTGARKAHFGSAVLGLADSVYGGPAVVVGAPDDSTNGIGAGAAYVLSTGDGYLYAGVYGDSAAHLGWALAPQGDINTDGYEDFLVGAPGTTVIAGFGGKPLKQAGAVLSVQAAASVDQVLLIANTLARGGQTGEQLGSAVISWGDLDHDGLREVLVGSPGYDAVDAISGKTLKDAGRVQLRSGAVGNTLIWDRAGRAAGDRFGAALAAGDSNGDGVLDAVIGAPGYDYVANLLKGKRTVRNVGETVIVSGKGLADAGFPL